MARRKTSDEKTSAADYLPENHDLGSLIEAAAHCRGCELYKNATQTVFGEGSKSAPFVLIGEQPGDQEDRQGRPFVGPSGDLLHRALAEAGFKDDDLYITNAVKHFRWRPLGKRRLHEKPAASHVKACRPWLLAELEDLIPDVVVCLGATAAAAVFGKAVTITSLRGRVVESPLAERTVVTVHPSSILRAPTEAVREAAYQAFVADLRFAKQAAAGRPSGRGLPFTRRGDGIEAPGRPD